MQEIKFDMKDAEHVCHGVVSGEWIIFTCEKCPGYEMWINTFDDRIKSVGQTIHRHRGWLAHKDAQS